MRSSRVRNRGVTQTLAAAATEAPSGVDTAFEELYRSSRGDVYAYVAGLLRDRSAAEDVTAQAFERAYRRRRTFNPGRGSRRAWLFGIARNAALDELRRRRRGARLVTDPEDDALAPAQEMAEVAGRRTALRMAIAGLFPREGRPGIRTEGETGSALSGLFERLRSVPPRRVLLSTGAAATLVVAVTVGIAVSDQLGGPGGGAGNIAAPSATSGPAVDTVRSPSSGGAS